MQIAGPRPKQWTRAEYYQMADLRFFEGQRVELIDGEIIAMAPQRNAHAQAVRLVDYALRPHFGVGYAVGIQAPLDLGPATIPEPDAWVATGDPWSHAEHPRTAVLVVEVSETSLEYDRGRKAALYAQAGIADYWVLDVPGRRLEVCRQPEPDAASPWGFRYASVAAASAGEAVSPLALPAARIAVSDLLP